MFLRLLISILTMSSNSLVSANFKPVPAETVNWTSCHEFVNNTHLDTERLLDKEWQIFFFWSPEPENSYFIKFSKPSSVLLDRFRVELDKDLEPPANWSNAVLFMETSVNFNSLLLNTSEPGIYRIIPTTAFEYAVKTPLLIFGFKLTDSNILGIVNCRYRICYALAPTDNMPHHSQLEDAAKTLNFYNPYNRTHIGLPMRNSRHPSDIPYSNDFASAAAAPDEEWNEDLEVEQDLGKMDFF